MISYRMAEIEDIPDILALYKKFHISTIRDQDKDGGFITAIFTADDLVKLINELGCISLAFDGRILVGFLFAADWAFWKHLDIFAFMMKHLPESKINDVIITADNSYHYGPVCVDTEYRGKGIFPKMFEMSKSIMREKYSILATFINTANQRSFYAHKNKIGLNVTKTFSFCDNEYYEVAGWIG